MRWERLGLRDMSEGKTGQGCLMRVRIIDCNGDLVDTFRRSDIFTS